MVGVRSQLVFRAVIQNLIGLPPLVLWIYFIVLGFPSSGFSHPGFWALLGLCIFWIYFFTAEGVLLLYGLLKFDCVTRSRRELGDCLSDLLEVLNKEGINYSVRKFVRGRFIRTNFGDILLVGLTYTMRSVKWEYTAVFYPRSLREVVEFEIW